MSVISIIFAVLDIVFAIGMIILFCVQEGNDNGMGVIAGGADSFYGKTQGRSFEQRLKKLTTICVIAFVISSVLLYLAVSRGW